MIRDHRSGEHDRAQQAQAAMLLIDAERGGAALRAPEVPGLGSALKRHQHLPPLVWPHTRRLLLADEQGLGKSIEAISLMLLEHTRHPLRAVVVCPTNLTDNWHAGFAEHAPGAFTALTARTRTPTEIPPGVNVVLIGWDVLRAWQPALSAWQPQVLTIDEGQLGKSGGGEWGSQRGEAAQQLAASVRAAGGGVMVLTGTPIDTRPLDALALFQLLAVDDVFGSAKTYEQTCCGPRSIKARVPVKVGRRTIYETREITTYKGASNTAQLHAILARQPWYIRRTKRLLIAQGEMQPKTVNGVDWYDYTTAPSPDVIELSTSWQATYEAAVTEFAQYVLALLAQEHPDWETLTDHQIVVLLERKLANVLPKLTLLRQVLGTAKIDAACERARALNAAGEQVVIIAHHREVVDEYVRRLCRNRELKILGGMSTREVEAVKRYFNSHGAAEAPVIVLSQEVAKLGHPLCLQRKLAGLPECAHVLIAEEGYNPGPEAQAMDRCILEGQRVITERGFLTIEQVVVGDKVLTHRGNWKRVLNTARRTHRGLVTKIRYTRYDEPLCCTHDHKLFVCRGDQAPEWREAYTVLPGDFLVMPRPLQGEQLTGLKFPEHLRRCEHQVNQFGSEQRKRPFVQMPDKIAVDPELLYLFGWYMAEGFTSTATGKGQFVSLSAHENERSTLERLGAVFSRWGVKWTIRARTSTRGIELRVYGAELAEWFAEGVGTGNKSKRLPPVLLTLPAAQAIHLLKGYSDGGGHRRNRQVEWKTVSPTIAQQMAELALQCGYSPALRRYTYQEREAWVGHVH